MSVENGMMTETIAAEVVAAEVVAAGVTVPVATEVVTCPRCDKVFKNSHGLRVHTYRAHSGKNWSNANAVAAAAKAKKARKASQMRWKAVKKEQRARTARIDAAVLGTTPASTPAPAAAPVPAPVAAPPVSLRYCPCCGLSLDLLVTALNAMAGVTHGG
jgi:uncharacterized C2H2 Zn-finger protein